MQLHLIVVSTRIPARNGERKDTLWTTNLLAESATDGLRKVQSDWQHEPTAQFSVLDSKPIYAGMTLRTTHAKAFPA
jgi:hypothetical protein